MYKALYRKYRPKTFEEVIGQEHITTVLKNQLKKNTISHAYLFSGTRGTGKTSCAKIFARAVNCESNGDKPCNKCSNCLESIEDSAIDIIEIDGASNSGIDNIRDLKDRAFYQPTSLKYKVYIIDEVHMLTRPAFNALLKILEEPPDHLIFILATTEPERIPLTILSRCQKFQFRRINSKDMLSVLNEIAVAEEVVFDDKTLNMIITNSDGSMRDAQSIMEQLVASGKKQINYEYAENLLGVVSSDVLFKLVDSILDYDASSLLELLDQTISSGKDVEQLGKDILNHFRNLMIAKASPKSLNKLVFSRQADYLKQSERTSLDMILNSMEKLINQLNELKYSQQKRTLLEIVMMEIIGIDDSMRVSHKMDLNQSSKTESLIINQVFDQNKIEKETHMRELVGIDNKDVTDERSSIIDCTSKDNKEILNLERIRKDWNDILREVRNSSRKLVHAYIIEASIVDYKNGTIILGFDRIYEFHKNNLMKKDNREFLENIISMFYNKNIKIDSVYIQEEEKSLVDEDIDTLTQLVGKENIVIV